MGKKKNGTGSTATEQQALRVYRLGTEKEDNNDYHGAIEAFTHAIKLNPNLIPAYHQRGLNRIYLEQYPEAIDDFTKIIEKDNEHIFSYLNRGVVYGHLVLKERNPEYYELAVRDLEFVVNFRSKTNLPNRSEEKLKPVKAQAYYNLASLHAEHGDYEKALAPINQAIKLGGDTTSNHLLLGRIYKELNQRDEAYAGFKRAIDLDPKNDDAYVYRAEARLEEKEYQKAIQDAMSAIRINRNNANAWYLRGLAHFLLCEYDTALNYYNQAIYCKPNFDGYYCSRADARLMLNQVNGALEDCEHAVKLNNKFIDARLLWACVLIHSGDYDKALITIKVAINIINKNEPSKNHILATALNIHGIVNMLNNNYDKALEDFNQSIVLDEQKESLYINRIYAYLMLKDFDRVKDEISSLSEKILKKEQGGSRNEQSKDNHQSRNIFVKVTLEQLELLCVLGRNNETISPKSFEILDEKAKHLDVYHRDQYYRNQGFIAMKWGHSDLAKHSFEAITCESAKNVWLRKLDEQNIQSLSGPLTELSILNQKQNKSRGVVTSQAPNTVNTVSQQYANFCT